MKRIEDFRKSFNKVMIDLDAFIESMQDLKTMRPTEISEILKRRSGTNVEMQNIVKLIIKNGKFVSTIKNVYMVDFCRNSFSSNNHTNNNNKYERKQARNIKNKTSKNNNRGNDNDSIEYQVNIDRAPATN